MAFYQKVFRAIMVNLSGGKKNLSARKFGNLQKTVISFFLFSHGFCPNCLIFHSGFFLIKEAFSGFQFEKKLRKKFYQALLKNIKFVKHGIKKGGQGAETEERRERSKQTFSRQSCLNPLRRSVPPSRCRPALRLRR